MGDQPNKEVGKAFDAYPKPLREQLLRLRKLILLTAKNTADVGTVEETLKWGEPSYRVNRGSAIRLSSSKTSPEHCGVFFNCQTSLIETCRELYNDDLVFVGNREICVPINEALPTDALANCFKLALTYHRVKHLPMLGM